jgi:hypothetical protein
MDSSTSAACPGLCRRDCAATQSDQSRRHVAAFCTRLSSGRLEFSHHFYFNTFSGLWDTRVRVTEPFPIPRLPAFQTLGVVIQILGIKRYNNEKYTNETPILLTLPNQQIVDAVRTGLRGGLTNVLYWSCVGKVPLLEYSEK